MLRLISRIPPRKCGCFWPTLRSIPTLLQSSWDGFGPTEQKNRHVVKSVATLLEKLIRNIEYHRLKKDEQLQEWVLGLSEKKLQMVMIGMIVV